jgi:hypothetical protein
MPKRHLPAAPDSQRQKFMDAARALGCDDDEEKFNAALRTVARHKPFSIETPRPEHLKTQPKSEEKTK